MPTLDVDRTPVTECPVCESVRVKVYDTRPQEDGTRLRWKRCVCGVKWVTREVFERIALPQGRPAKGEAPESYAKAIRRRALEDARDAMCNGCVIGLPGKPGVCMYEHHNAPDGRPCFAEPIRVMLKEMDDDS